MAKAAEIELELKHSIDTFVDGQVEVKCDGDHVNSAAAGDRAESWRRKAFLGKHYTCWETGQCRKRHFRIGSARLQPRGETVEVTETGAFQTLVEYFLKASLHMG